MCDICRPILGRTAKNHAGKPCILGKVLYCNLCSVYGHSPSQCPKTAMKLLREETVRAEELVEEPLVYSAPEKWIEISDSEQAFSSMLIANKIVPMACQEKGKLDERDYHNNKERLMNLVESTGAKLVLLALPWAKAEDEQLRELILANTDEGGKIDWKQVAVKMTRRTQEHCKARHIVLQQQSLQKNKKSGK